jgi:peptidyl-prolyl cis-trans isomerase D
MAQNSFTTFQGVKSDFITQKETKPLAGLNPQESTEFLNKLFSSKQKRGFLALQDGNILLYNISDQKLLYNTAIKDSSSLLKLKQEVLDQKLLKKLTATYPIEIYAEGI